MYPSPSTGDLFDLPPAPSQECLSEGAYLLRRFALDVAGKLLHEIEAIAIAAPFRHWLTPGGLPMSAAMTSCGEFGWVSDRKGYRYERCDPRSGQPWPAMPAAFLSLPKAAAHAAGFPNFEPDSCLINAYEPGARLTLHQDRDERDLSAPVVSVSLGLPATFLWGGLRRQDKHRRIPLEHGDVVAWGGASRLNYHGVLPIKPGANPLPGERRLNLTFRRAQ